MAPAVRRLSLRSASRRGASAGGKSERDVDQHCHNLRPFLILGLPQWEIGMETTGQPRAGSSVRASATFKEVDSEFTKPGLIWGRYILRSRCSAAGRRRRRLVFGKRIAGMSLPESVSLPADTVWVSRWCCSCRRFRAHADHQPGSRRDSVGEERRPGAEVAAYASTPMWVAGIFNIHGRFLMVGIIIRCTLSICLPTAPTLMKGPQDRSIGLTAVVIIAAIVASCSGVRTRSL